MVNPNEILELISELACLKYFPSDQAARLAIARLAASMATDKAQLRRLVSRMTNGAVYSEWPGPAEMRACFCAMFKPKDGIEANSTVYPDGIPSERPAAPQLAAPERLRLREPVSADAEMVNTVREIAERHGVNNHLKVIERLKGIAPAGDDEIAKIKAAQAAAALHPETRQILADPGTRKPARRRKKRTAARKRI